MVYISRKGVSKMYAYMTSRVHNYIELLKYAEKCRNTKPIQISIIKEIQLENRALEKFLSNFKTDQDWMIPYIRDMNSSDLGQWQCILISSDLLEFPIIVYSNNCLYPQYVGILQ